MELKRFNPRVVPTSTIEAAAAAISGRIAHIALSGRIAPMDVGAIARLALEAAVREGGVQVGEHVYVMSKQVRAITPCEVELDGRRYVLARGDYLEVPGLKMVMS